MKTNNLEVTLFSEQKIIPLRYNIGSFGVTNIKLPNIVVSNNGQEKYKLIQVTVKGINAEREIASYSLYAERLAEIIEIVTPQISAMLEDPNSLDSLKLTFGKVKPLKYDFSENIEIKQNESLLIPLSFMLYFDYIGLDNIDKLKLFLTVQNELKKEIIEFPIELVSFNTKEKYLFPLKGELCICNLPMNIVQHRMAHSQEFAIDIVGTDYSSFNSKKHAHVSKYSIYENEVLAIGNGIVVEVGNKFPDIKMSNPQEYTEDYFKLIYDQLLPTLGFKNIVMGNYLIIKHENDEFSFYAHLKEDSICVEVGSAVTQGEVIAKVGNSGHSTEPHLHFQLIDSIDIFQANGLPIIFKNLPIKSMNQHFSNTNSLINSDYFFANIE